MDTHGIDTPHVRDHRKIDPTKIDPARPPRAGDAARERHGLRPDGTPDDNDRVEIGPTALAFAEWEAAGLTAPNLAAMRQYRLDRIVAKLHERDLAGVFVTDPLNIRYATDCPNMQVWNTHNPFRACLVLADGHMVVWDYKATDLLTAHNPLVRETRGGAAMFYFSAGDLIPQIAVRIAGEVSALLREHVGDNRRIAVDKIQIEGLRALEAVGLSVSDGEEVMEKARAIKGPDEIRAMRCASDACEKALYAMEATVAPGLTENEVWAVLHAENIKRGGEWIETRLLSTGPRTNPWFQECGPRVMSAGEILAFDTDLVGVYGMCVDISRTWLVGDVDPTEEQIRLYREAHAQIVENAAILKPGMSFREVSHAGRALPEEFKPLRYGVKMHGVGLCDEWPHINYPEDIKDGAFEYALEPGMMLCVEAYIGAVGGKEGIKLEEQVLITEDGYENLTTYPYDRRLLGE
ncbi:MAG: dimethylsulfonioproprionate lyase DddP [Pseudomonadota bacterium]